MSVILFSLKEAAANSPGGKFVYTGADANKGRIIHSERHGIRFMSCLMPLDVMWLQTFHATGRKFLPGSNWLWYWLLAAATRVDAKSVSIISVVSIWQVFHI